MESQDLKGLDIDNIALPIDAKFTPKEITIEGSRMMALETQAYVRDAKAWEYQLYRTVDKNKHTATIRLIPYYAWGNRGKGEMSIWIPVAL